MYRKELQTLLSKDSIPNFFFLYGADNFQSELYAEFIKEKYKPDETLKLFFEEYNFTHASDFLSTGSLFRKTLKARLNSLLLMFHNINKKG